MSANRQTNGGSANGESTRNLPKDGDYIQWDCAAPEGQLNRWSTSMTKDHDYTGAQVSCAVHPLLANEYIVWP